LVEKPEGKRLLGAPRCRWQNNIRMDLRERGWENVNWIHLVQDSDQWRALMTSWVIISFSRRDLFHVVS
jgi:hypothetical protein